MLLRFDRGCRVGVLWATSSNVKVKSVKLRSESRVTRFAELPLFETTILDYRIMRQLFVPSRLFDFSPLSAKYLSVFQRFNKWQVPLTRIER